MKDIYADISSRDFSDIEDRPDAFLFISDIAAKAARAAIAEARAAGLPRIFIRDKIIRVHSNGMEEIVNAPLPASGSFFVSHKPGILRGLNK